MVKNKLFLWSLSNVPHVYHGTCKRMNCIDFAGYRSKVKVTVDKYGHNLMNTTRNLTVECISVNLDTGVAYDETISPIDF